MKCVKGTDISVLGIGTFYGSGLSSFTVPSTVREIGQAAFSACKSMKSVRIENGLTVLGKEDPVENGNRQCGVFENSEIEWVILPPSLKCIKSYAFKGCEKIKVIELPDSIEKIGFNCFQDCAIMQINIPKNLRKI